MERAAVAHLWLAGPWYAIRVMGLNEILRKVFLVDLMQGLGVTFRYQHPKEIYTEQYPLERPQVAERYRGAPRLNIIPIRTRAVHRV